LFPYQRLNIRIVEVEGAAEAALEAIAEAVAEVAVEAAVAEAVAEAAVTGLEVAAEAQLVAVKPIVKATMEGVVVRYIVVEYLLLKISSSRNPLTVRSKTFSTHPIRYDACRSSHDGPTLHVQLWYSELIARRGRADARVRS